MSARLDSIIQIAGLILTAASTAIGYLAYRASRPAPAQTPILTVNTPAEHEMASSDASGGETPVAQDPTPARVLRTSRLARLLIATPAVLGAAVLPTVIAPPIRHVITGTVEGYFTVAAYAIMYFAVATQFINLRRRGIKTIQSTLLIGLIVVVFAVVGTQYSYDHGTHAIKDLIGAFVGWTVLTTIPAYFWIGWRMNAHTRKP